MSCTVYNGYYLLGNRRINVCVLVIIIYLALVVLDISPTKNFQVAIRRIIPLQNTSFKTI